MPGSLEFTPPHDSPLSWQDLIYRLLLASAYGACVAVVYQVSYGRRKPDGSVMITTLVLLAILVAMVSMVIGESTARAFSLVGALSIVRFRTVVEDTRDTVFVIYAVIVGMAAGTGSMLVPVVGIPIVTVAALVLSRSRSTAPNADPLDLSSSLTVRLGLGRDPELVLGDVLRRHLVGFLLSSVETARQGSALDLKYQVQLRSPESMTTLVTELNQIEGVQSVEIRV